MVETKPQRKRRKPAQTEEAAQEVVSSVQAPVTEEQPQKLPHSRGPQERIERLPSGLVVIHQ